jgi:hypothetical protein
MAIDTAHRSSIYQSLIPVMGEENADVLMSQFPATEGDELVTKQFLRAELADVRSQIAEQGGAFERTVTRQTYWLAGVVLTSLLGGLAASAALASGFG